MDDYIEYLPKIINGALPPSSKETRFMVDAHSSIMILPTAVDPVNETLRISLLVDNSLPTSLTCACVVTIFNTPLGIPARSANSANANAE
jgi:hypothetical protein